MPPLHGQRDLGIRFLRYAVIALITVAAADGIICLLPLAPAKPNLYTDNLVDKTRCYLAEAERYDLVFVGDSRTLCAYDPELIDAELGTHSVNVGHWAHWFSTQFPQIEDLAPRIPAGATVVWSIGHQNFRTVNGQAINRRYPMGVDNAPRYAAWGFTWPQMSDNVEYSLACAAYDRLTWLEAVQKRESLMRLVIQKSPERTAAGCRNEAQYEVAAAAWRKRHEVASISPAIDGDVVTSLIVLGERGNYLRQELVPEYFRAKQQELAAQLGPLPTAEELSQPQYWSLFRAMLDEFEHRQIRLIVVELEEAPYYYADPERRALYRHFMEQVAQVVRERGFPYVRVDWEQFTDADYFDYNHLNRTGVERYTPLIARELRPLLAEKSRPSTP